MYQAPETYENSKNFTQSSQEKVDIFSFAMVMYYLKYGCHPWDPKKDQDEVQKFVSDGLRPPLGDHSSCGRRDPSDVWICNDHETAPKQNSGNTYWFWNCFKKEWVERINGSIQLSNDRNFANPYDAKYLNLMSVLSSAIRAAAIMSSPSLQARVLEPQS